MPGRAFSFLFFFLLLVVTPTRAATFDLGSAAWKITVDPATLAISARLPDGRAVLISSGQPGLGALSDSVVDASSAQWTFGARKVTASASLQGNALTVHFSAAEQSRFTWPVYDVPKDPVRYIIPKGEGLLMDPRSPVWRSSAWPREMDTMEDFALPLWGVMGKGWTLTYLLENPFDNTFAFRATGQALSWSLEHQFKPLWKRKEFGVVIVLGPESPIEPAREYRRRLIASGQFVSMKEKIAKTPAAEKLLGAAHAYVWDLSSQLLSQLQSAGLDRLWLGVPGLAEIKGREAIVRSAVEMGYLIGPYDSYDSVHSPHQKDTWESAQFDEKLFEEGAIVGADGKKVPGFQKKGYWLSSLAARPYVEQRVTRTFEDFPFNSFFMDCDAAGFLHDNYAPRFIATEADDLRERLARMQWIVDRFHAPIGSEDGHWYAAPVIHFAHGMMTPVFGFSDPRFRNKTSRYYLGRYWPPDGPDVFMKSAQLPDDYRAIYFDPRSRIPLFQTVFHDSVITTHHWTMPSMKFPEVASIDSLLELLYGVPPLYHFNSKELTKDADRITRYYRFFSPLHRQTALLAMEDFRYLTADHLVQRTTFGEAIQMTANFGATTFQDGNTPIPSHGIAARHLDTGRVEIFVAGP